MTTLHLYNEIIEGNIFTLINLLQLIAYANTNLTVHRFKEKMQINCNLIYFFSF